jgi:hypothetical protein
VLVTDQPTTDHLSGEEVTALKAAARRQLARWAKKSELSPHQRAQPVEADDGTTSPLAGR